MKTNISAAQVLGNTRKALVLSAALLLGGGLAASSVRATPPALHVSGNQLVDDSGNAVFLKGANLSGLESADTPTDPNTGVTLVQSADGLLGGSWNAKIIRLPISQDRWMGYQVSDRAAYRQRVYDIVSKASNANAYVIVDLHWSDLGDWGNNLGQHNMPDDNTTSAWQDISHDPNLSGNPAVFFGLYNEPHDVSPDIWLNGGQVTNEQYGGGNPQYHTPGMQGLINTVRQEDNNGNRASDNVLFVGGLNYAYDLTFVANGSDVPQDPGGRGIVYDVHIYPLSNDQKPTSTDYATLTNAWNTYAGVEAKNAPLFIGEYGGGDYGESADAKTWIEALQGWASSQKKSGGFCGTTAWAFGPYFIDGYRLISDTSSFTPTQYEGYTVQYYINNGN